MRVGIKMIEDLNKQQNILKERVDESHRVLRANSADDACLIPKTVNSKADYKNALTSFKIAFKTLRDFNGSLSRAQKRKMARIMKNEKIHIRENDTEKNELIV